MNHMNPLQKTAWALSLRGHDVIYPHTSADYLLLKSQLIKQAHSLNQYETSMVKRAYEAPISKTASKKEKLKVKIAKAIITDVGERESRKIELEAKKGLRLISKKMGFRHAEDFVVRAHAARFDNVDPLHLIFKDRTEHLKDHTQIANLMGSFTLALHKKDTKRAAEILGVDEQVILFYIISEGGKKNPFIQEMMKVGSVVKDFPSLTDTLNNLSWKDYFSKKAYSEIMQYFKDARDWFNVDPIPKRPEFIFSHPLDSAAETYNWIEDSTEVVFWDKVKESIVGSFKFIKELPFRIFDACCAVYQEGWAGLMEDKTLTIIGASLLIYLFVLAVGHFSLWISELPLKVIIVWPFKIFWYFLKKLLVGGWKLTKMAYTFISDSEVRNAILNRWGVGVKEFFFGYDKDEYQKDPEAILEMMV